MAEGKGSTFFSERLKWLMERDGFTCVSLGKKLGINQANIWRYVKGYRSEVTIQKAVEIADFFGVDVGWLIGQESAKAPEGWDEREEKK